MSDEETYRGDRIYYNWDDQLPFEIVTSVDDPNADYSFDIALIVRDKRDGKLWGASDSGCSCPTPFEDHLWPTDWSEIRSEADAEALLSTCHRALKSDYLRMVQEAL